MNWGDFKNDGCSRATPGTTQYSSRLWGIRPGMSWENACKNTWGKINGVDFKPTRCVNKGFGGMWGEFDVPSSSCGGKTNPHTTTTAHWGELSKPECSKSTLGKQTYSARLWDVPANQTWEDACHSKSVTLPDGTSKKPDRCVNKGVSGMWGEWDVTGAKGCEPTWGDVKQECLGTGKVKYSSRLWSIPEGYSWEKACSETPATLPDGTSALPTRCVNTGVTGMWGEWEKDANTETCPKKTETAVDKLGDFAEHAGEATLNVANGAADLLGGVGKGVSGVGDWLSSPGGSITLTLVVGGGLLVGGYVAWKVYGPKLG